MAQARSFPALKAKQALRVLHRIGYEQVRQTGSHRKLTADGRDPISFAFHHGKTVPPVALRLMLVKQAKLTDDEITRVLKGGRL